jgi:hypothetical protein
MMINAFLIRERVFRCQWQRIMEYCLSCTSANQSGPDIVLLSETCDNTDNVHRWRRRKDRAWNAVVQVALQSGSSADLGCKSVLQHLWASSGPTMCSSRKTKMRWLSCCVI